MKKNKLLLVSLIIGALYLIYCITYWTGANTSTGSSSYQLGTAIATTMVLPHLVVTGIAVIFNALAFFMDKKAFALVAGILYAVAMLLFILYFWGDLVEMILCFVAYSQMKKIETSTQQM